MSIDTSSVQATVTMTATHVGDIECGGLTERASHTKLPKEHRKNDAGQPLYTDPRDGSETTDAEHWSTPEAGGQPERVGHEPIMDQPMVEFMGQSFEKYDVGGGTFSAPLEDENNRAISRGNHRTGELPASIQADLIKAAVYVRLLYADAKGVLHRPAGATVAPYVKLLESAVAAEFGLADPNAA